jgi:aldehyde:ferredoxin oxidoreductase
MKGFCGQALWIDLQRQQAERKPLEEELLRVYPGGGLLGAYQVYRLTEADTDALSPGNPLVIATGPAAGAAVSGVSRASACALSPLTGVIGESQAGGQLAPALKKAGLDALVITGRAPRPLWLRIENQRVSFEDASEIAGLSTIEVLDRLEEKCGREAVIVQCGPAGEKQVRFANMLSGRNDVFGRTGLGAVLGAKKLRALAVSGSGATIFADVGALKSLARRGAQRLEQASFPLTLSRHGTAGVVGFQAQAGNLASHNHSRGSIEGYEKLAGESFEPLMGAGATTCYGCVVRCRRKVKHLQAGIHAGLGGPEFETLGLLGSNLDITDPVEVARSNQLCNELGLDTITTGALLAWLMECRERGLISPAQLEGIDLRFGDAEAAREVIRRIGQRQGIGNILADGFGRAIEHFGRGCEPYAVHTKNQGFAVHMPQVKPSQALIYAASPIGPDHQSSEHDWLLEAGGDDCFGLGIVGRGDRASTGPAKVRMTVFSQQYYSLLDTLCLCDFCWGPGNLFTYSELTELVRAATGWGVTFHELMKAGERRIHLMRRLNARRGFDRRQDRLPPRMFEPLGEGPSRGRRVAENFGELLDQYYQVLGCDPLTGHPTPGKLLELGLEWTL